jgi:RimJ/RimL family protein N-acetyltransferase
MAIDDRLVFYAGEHVLLKALSPQDVEESDWVRWFNDEQMSTYNQHHYFPNTFAQQHEHLKSCVSSSKLQLGIVDRLDLSSICGVVSLNSIDWVNRHAEIAGIQAERTKANSALFLESWSLMLRHGFQQLGLRKIYGGTFHPHVANALVRIFNFEIEGVRRRHVYKNGALHDITLVGVFADSVQYPEFQGSSQPTVRQE